MMGKGFGKGYGMMPRGAYTGGMGMGMGMGMGGFGRFSPYPKRYRTRVGSIAIKVQPVPPEISEEDLKYAFGGFGEITLVVIKDGTPRHAYVNFTKPEEANAAAATQNVELAGQSCYVGLSLCQKPHIPEGEPTNGIGIFNMPFSMTYDEILSLISAYPGFLSLKMVTRKTGEFKGYCFAYFNTVEDATYAKSMLMGMTIGDQVLDCKFSNKPLLLTAPPPQ